MLRKTFNIILVTGALAAMAACNTLEGAGEDVQSAADAVDKKT